MKKDKKKNRKWLWITISSLSVLFVFAVIMGQLSITSALFGKNRFFKGTNINGIDVSGMTTEEVSNLISTRLNSERDNVKFTLTYNDKKWEFFGKDFEAHDEVTPVVQNLYSYGRVGNFWERRKAIQTISKKGFNSLISYKNVLGGFDEKINNIIADIEKEPLEPEVKFVEDAKMPFKVIPAENGIKVKKDELYNLIDTEFAQNKEISVEIPTEEIEPVMSTEEMEKNLTLRGSFSTSYKGGQANRRFNVKKALKDFNGMKVDAGQKISFNEVTGDKTEANGYKPAKIILNGVYIDGAGGGVCQSATTLYNALLNSDIQIDEVNRHSLPVSYVWLAFDAMVSEGFSDLVFTNNTAHPIYIASGGDENSCYVEVYGEPFAEGKTLSRRAEFVRTIPHNGDTIIQDTNKEYSNKITYKGEYLRLKTPMEGYESNAYIDYYENGELVDSKLIRHEIYEPQMGVIIEGTEELMEGMTIPPNDVKFIPPQKQTTTTEENVEKKLEAERPTEFNP